MQHLDRLDDTRSLSRREFTLEWAMAMLAGVAITVSGCGSDSPSSPTSSTGGGSGGSTSGDVTGVVSANHGHVATILAAQLAGGTLNLNIMGNATHAHTVTLTGAQLQQIGAKQQVAVLSTTDSGHNHTVTFN